MRETPCSLLLDVIEALDLRVDCKYNIDLETLLQQGIQQAVFYGDLVYKF